jgi:hypothetical protein
MYLQKNKRSFRSHSQSARLFLFTVSSWIRNRTGSGLTVNTGKNYHFALLRLGTANSRIESFDES